MTSELLVTGFLRYVVFLFSTTCHEAAHAWVAHRGGDSTAYEGGQVSLSPWPHIRREPFGMVVLPLLSLLLGGGMVGWASAPYNPVWQRNFPKRAALMALAGPLANFTLVILSGVALRIGGTTGFFSGDSEVIHGVEVILGIFFQLNVLLGIFNLLPFPPFDGFGVLGFFTGGGRLESMRMQIRQYSMIGLILGWQLIRYIYPPVLDFVAKVLLGSA